METLGGTPLLPILAGIAGVIALGSLLVALRSLVAGRDEVIERLERVRDRQTPAVGLLSTPRSGPMASAAARMLRPFAWLVRPRQQEKESRVKLRLVRAGYRGEHAVEIYLGSKLLLAPIVVITFLQINSRLANPLAFPLDAAVATWLCALAFWFPNLWLRGKIDERKKAIERSLPDALDLLVACVEAGLGIDAALHRVAEELRIAAPVLGDELETTFLEVQAGLPRPEGFRRLAERTGVEDLRSLSAMLIQTEMFGTSVAKALRVMAESMRIRRMQRAEERAGMLAVKLTVPLVLCILPSLIAIIMGPAVITINRAFIER
jgi:tight adherence protein C